MSDLPARYRPHATRPELVVCIECSGNPEAVIPRAAVDAHQQWHDALAQSGPPWGPRPEGDWPELGPVPPHLSELDAGRRANAAKRFMDSLDYTGNPEELALVLVEELGPDRLIELLDSVDRRLAER